MAHDSAWHCLNPLINLSITERDDQIFCACDFCVDGINKAPYKVFMPKN